MIRSIVLKSGDDIRGTGGAWICIGGYGEKFRDQ